MAPPITVNIQKRYEFWASEVFFERLEYLAIRYTNGKRSQLIRDCVEQLYSDALAASASTSETSQGGQHG